MSTIDFYIVSKTFATAINSVLQQLINFATYAILQNHNPQSQMLSIRFSANDNPKLESKSQKYGPTTICQIQQYFVDYRKPPPWLCVCALCLPSDPVTQISTNRIALFIRSCAVKVFALSLQIIQSRGGDGIIDSHEANGLLAHKVTQCCKSKGP